MVFFGTSIGDLKGLSLGSIPPFPTKNQGVKRESLVWESYRKIKLVRSYMKVLLLMIPILHYLKDPKLWELWSIIPYGFISSTVFLARLLKPRLT